MIPVSAEVERSIKNVVVNKGMLNKEIFILNFPGEDRFKGRKNILIQYIKRVYKDAVKIHDRGKYIEVITNKIIKEEIIHRCNNFIIHKLGN